MADVRRDGRQTPCQPLRPTYPPRSGRRAALVPSAPVAVVLDRSRRRLIVTGGSRGSRWTRSRRWPRRSTPGARTGFRKSFLKALGCAWRSSCEQGQTVSGSTVLVRDVVVRHAGPAEEPDRWNRRSRRAGRPGDRHAGLVESAPVTAYNSGRGRHSRDSSSNAACRLAARGLRLVEAARGGFMGMGAPN